MTVDTLVVTALIPLFGAIGLGFGALWKKLGKKDDTILELSRDNIAIAEAAKQDARHDVESLMRGVDAMKSATESIQNMSQMREDIIEIRSILEGQGRA